MRSCKMRQQPLLLKKLQRAYRYSELRKLQLWLKGKTLHWAFYLISVTFLMGALLGLQHYFAQFFYVVTLEGREVGMVRNAGEIEEFLGELNACCSSFYGMAVEPRQEISFNREYRSDGEEEASIVKEVLRQQIDLITEAVMITVDGVPAVPVASEKEIAGVIDLLSKTYINDSNNVKLVEVSLEEELAGAPCSIPPEAVCTPAEAAAQLLSGEMPNEDRLLLASRHGGSLRLNGASDMEPLFPVVHVHTVEEIKIAEKIPFKTSYTYNDKLWYVKSHVLTPGKVGEKVVTYRVTRENGREVARKAVGEKILQEPVTQVIEKGTSQVSSLGTGRFRWPVAGGTISSGFRTRARPSHIGVDIVLPGGGGGAPILAADDGVVVETGCGSSLGKYIVIYHGSYYTVYAHNSVNYVSAGSKVSRGQTIALMGNTGRTRGITGIHLHFEVRRSDGSGVWGHWYKNPAVNPLSFF